MRFVFIELKHEFSMFAQVEAPETHEMLILRVKKVFFVFIYSNARHVRG